MDRSRFRHASPQKKPQKDYWDWWLSDEQPSAAAREQIRQQRVRQASNYQPRSLSPRTAVGPAAAAYDDVKSVVINLSLPKPRELPAYLSKIKSIRMTKRRAAGLAAAVILIVLIGRGPASPAADKSPDSNKSAAVTAASGTSGISILTNNQPEVKGASTTAPSPNSVSSSSKSLSFKPVAPSSNPQLADSPFGRSAYDSNAGVYTYLDSFMGQQLTVNQEAVPGAYTTNVQALQDQAQKIGASQAFSFNGNTAYMQPAGSGQQSVITLLRGILVTLNSPTAHSVSDWTTYLQTLN